MQVPVTGAADISPYIQKAVSTHPQAIYVGPSGTQSAILDAFTTAGYPSDHLIFNFSLAVSG